MKAPISWLKDYVDIDVTPKELAEKLLHVGFEVEEIDYLGKNIDNIVVGHILEISRHPDADKLTVCKVDVGERGGQIQIVTAGTNIKVNDYVPVALVGALLSDGTIIKKGKLRGVESFGMFCSGNELGIGNETYDGAGEDKILVLHGEQTPGTDIRKVVGLDEYVLDIGILANRPDCQSIIGIAREIACVLNKPFRHPEITYKQDVTKSIGSFVDASVQAKELCTRYILSAVDNVEIKQSPKYIRDRLRWVGINSINNIVDITNFILIEMGQPMHAFDGKKIGGNQINVRTAVNGETVQLLDDKNYPLDSNCLVICDSQKPIALAGIMGGKNESISETTTSVVFESAKFIRENIRKTSRKLAVHSDSSQMFERGVDAYTSLVAMNRALNLICSMQAGEVVAGEIDILNENLEKKVIRCNVDKIYSLLGIEIEVGVMMNILQRLNIITTFENNELVCEIPYYRSDIEGYPDIAEEIIRVYGYEHITATILSDAKVIKGGFTKEQNDIIKAKNTLIALGYNEIVTYSFVGQKAFDNTGISSENAIRLINPLGEELSIMRANLVHYMLKTVSLNINRNQTEGRLFEFAKVYENIGKELPKENDVLALSVFGDGEDFFTLKGSVETLFEVLGIEFEVKPAEISYMHPYRTAEIVSSGEIIGYLGEISPETANNYEISKKTYFAEIYYEKIKSMIDTMKKFKPIPKFPCIVRDIAVLVENDTVCGDMLSVIKQNASKLCVNVELFDIYTGKQVTDGFKSMAFKISFQSQEKTLTDKDVDKCIMRVLNVLQTTFGAKLREM